MGNIRSMEEANHGCCPKGGATCRCHLEHAEPETFAPAAPLPKTAALPCEAHLENVRTPDALSISSGGAEVARPEMKSEVLIDAAPVGGGSITNLEAQPEVNPEALMPVSGAEVAKSEEDGHVDGASTSILPITKQTPNSELPNPEIPRVEEDHFMSVPLKEPVTQEHTNFSKVKIYNKGKKIDGAGEIKGALELNVEDLPLPEELENDSSQKKAPPIESWIKQLLTTKVAAA